MRAVIQRVNNASCVIDDKVISYIDKGLLVLLGISKEDTKSDMDYILSKLVGLRIFEDHNGKMNLSIKDIGASILLISQFTLYGDARKGRRPSFSDAARPEKAEAIYNELIEMIEFENINIKTGVFGEDMKINLQNDGPVTILLDSQRRF